MSLVWPHRVSVGFRRLPILAVLLTSALATATDSDAIAWGDRGAVVKTGEEVPARARVRMEGQLDDPSPTFRLGKPVRFRYEVRNEGTKNLVLWHTGFWANHRLILTDAAGAEPTKSRFGRDAAASFAPRGPRDKNVPWSLAAGKVSAGEGDFDLNELYDLSKPGVYVLQILYEEDISLATNRLPFVIH